MDWQPGITLLTAVASGLVGAGFAYGKTKAFVILKSTEHEKNIAKLEAAIVTLTSKVVFDDACKKCEKRWDDKHIDTKEDIRGLNSAIMEVNGKLDQVLLHLATSKE